MSAYSRRILLTAAFAVLSIPTTSLAADMVVYGREQVSPHKTHHQTRTVEKMGCTENLVSYRSPYQRHTELVTLCHPPINWRTGPSTATIWSP
ncbi:hypothetical protein EDB97_102306 [Agrobacterium tumefaciens]|uniref:Secreted protein n=1 Tax=Agrobacterium tumefaciens TaxID=358 RepID=A0AAW8LV80_AGRTU|nr:hypothetical protein [Agrobacterium tumefaciens]TCV54003.1 hypothetical protein EDB97_102306 [Agrobacterium tumefaciens]